MQVYGRVGVGGVEDGIALKLSVVAPTEMYRVRHINDNTVHVKQETSDIYL